MKRSALAVALLVLTPGLRVARGWEDAPPLTPPALEPPAESPSPSPAPAVEKVPNRPLLVIPGVTAPAARIVVQKPTTAPPLDGPRPFVAPAAGGDDDPRVTLSLPLEPIPPDDGTAPQEAKPVSEGEDKPPADPKPSPAPSPHRPHGVLGRLWGTETASPTSGDGITIEPHSDPAVEAAVKRRVEKQILESLGDRVRDVEVRVKGRDILIRARASHFWLHRTARRTLDALPLPAGYRGRVEMN